MTQATPNLNAGVSAIPALQPAAAPVAAAPAAAAAPATVSVDAWAPQATAAVTAPAVGAPPVAQTPGVVGSFSGAVSAAAPGVQQAFQAAAPGVQAAAGQLGQTLQAQMTMPNLTAAGPAAAALVGVRQVGVMARWKGLLDARKFAAMGSRNAARVAGRSVGVMSRVTKQMSAAKSVAQKAPLVKGLRLSVTEGLRRSFFSIGNVSRAVGLSALTAVPIAAITNFLDYKAGKINAQQRNALILADAAGYTVSGAGATLLGGAVASTVMGPFLGTLVGIGAGFLFGHVYERFVRPKAGQMAAEALYPGVAAAVPQLASPLPAPAPVGTQPVAPQPTAPEAPAAQPPAAELPPADPAVAPAGSTSAYFTP